MIGDRWGVSDDEVVRRYPCDDFVPAPSLQLWRGVTVRATPETTWPWITQIQCAPYSYDWIDNFGQRSPQQLLDLPAPVPGQHFTSTANRPQGRLLAVDSPVHYTGCVLGAVMSYVLLPVDDHTRLLLKISTSRWGRLAPVVSVGDLLMARRQLLNLKRLAENPPGHPRGVRTHRRG